MVVHEFSFLHVFMSEPPVAISWRPWVRSTPSYFQWDSDRKAALLLNLSRDNICQLKKKQNKNLKKMLDLAADQTSVRSN